MNEVGEYIRQQVPDWDDEVVATARFKAFSGQRPDWEPRFFFWRDLILKVARHLRLFRIQSSQVRDWFNRQGLTPLCIDHVLLEMYDAGELLRKEDLADQTNGGLSQLLKRVVRLMGISSSSAPEISRDYFIVKALLVERANEVVKLLSESHWSSFCIVTLEKFRSLCHETDESSIILSYLSANRKAKLLSVTQKDFIEGVKVSLVPTDVPPVSTFDCSLLHLTWTSEQLQQQLDVLDQRHEMLRRSALASIKSENKQVALRYARQMKLTSESREKCTSLLNRVEEVLTVIADAESTKKVSEAIQIGSQAIKKCGITVEEIQDCLDELDERVFAQKQVEEALVSTTPYTNIEDEELEEELKELELELGEEIPKKQTSGPAVIVQESLKSGNSICKTESDSKMADSATLAVDNEKSLDSLTNNLSTLKLEAA